VDDNAVRDASGGIILTPSQITTIVDDLRGTTGSLEETINEVLETTVDGIDAISSESLSAIDDEIFLCDACGWWCGTDEYSPQEDAGQTCDECLPAEDEE
jgi:hypothetical protein